MVMIATNHETAANLTLGMTRVPRKRERLKTWLEIATRFLAS